MKGHHETDGGASADHANRVYYDEFAAAYEAERGGRVPGGYHDLIDELEVGFLARFAEGADVLEVGCGTGLIMVQTQRFARRVTGLDVSPGMLERARARGLDVVEGSATALPFPDDHFDVVCAFKVLAHVPDLARALDEMARVSRRWVIAECYNPFSLRALVKRFGPAGAISGRTREDAVYTRYDSPAAVHRALPPGTHVAASRGIRIVTPVAGALRWPVAGPLLRTAERRWCDGALSRFGGFWIAAIRTDR
ncbi:MAG: class I SAM-dependent methyltransferase [Myxococcota bacterium]